MRITKQNDSLTMVDVAPVDTGEEGVAADSLVSQSVSRATQQTLHQVKEVLADLRLPWKLEESLQDNSTETRIAFGSMPLLKLVLHWI